MKSNWEDYTRAAAALAGEHATGPDLRTRVAYLGLGLAGEAGEAEQAVVDGDASQILVELGDCAFHLALVEVAFGERAAASDVRPPNIMRAACEVAECCKRALVLRNVGLGRLRSALAWCRDSLADLARRHVPGGLAEVLRVNIAKCEGIARGRVASGDTVAARESKAEDFLCGLRAAGPTEGVEFGSAAPGISADGPLWFIVARRPGSLWRAVQVPVESTGAGDAAGARVIAHKVAIELTRERIRDLGPMPTLPPFEAHELPEYRADPCRGGAGALPCDGPNGAALESPQS